MSFSNMQLSAHLINNSQHKVADRWIKFREYFMFLQNYVKEQPKRNGIEWKIGDFKEKQEG